MQRQTIGRYQILEELGRGAMGIVFRAVDSIIGRTVAIKTIRLDRLSDPAERDKLKDRLLREARSAGLLSHRNIVTVYDVGEEDGVAFIAMEYIAGQTVEQKLRDQGRLERNEVVDLIAQVAAALDYAHGQGVVHRDIKPGNVMVAEADGSVKITDFGVAKILSHQMTQADMLLGTPNYMAPEQIEARGVDGRTDQFGLAVIGYELLTGERPFHSETLSPLLIQILRADPAPPHLLNAALNERVSGVFVRGLAKAPADRFATCSAFAKALTQALSTCGDWQPLARAAAGTMATVAAPLSVPAAPVEIDPPAFTRDEGATARRWPLVAGVSMAMAIIASGYYLLQPRRPEPIAPPAAPAAAATEDSRPSPLADAIVPAHAPETAAPVATETLPAAAPAPVKPNPPAAGPVSGVVEIASSPPGATVRIDDTRDQCQTPCSMELSQGRHLLHFSLEKYRPGTLIVTVPFETSASMRLDPLTGTLMVHTAPPGAAILLNGQAQQDTSPATLRLAPGKYRLTLRYDGVRDHTQEVEVRDEAITQVDFAWK